MRQTDAYQGFNYLRKIKKILEQNGLLFLLSYTIWYNAKLYYVKKKTKRNAIYD